MSSPASILRDMRAIAAAFGVPSLIRDVDGDGLMLTVEPLQFIPFAARPGGEAGRSASPLSGGAAGVDASSFHAGEYV